MLSDFVSVFDPFGLNSLCATQTAGLWPLSNNNLDCQLVILVGQVSMVRRLLKTEKSNFILSLLFWAEMAASHIPLKPKIVAGQEVAATRGPCQPVPSQNRLAKRDGCTRHICTCWPWPPTGPVLW